MKIKVGVSNRHIHLTNEVKDILFGKDYEFTKRNDLSQFGEYAYNETIIIKTNKSEIENVRILGPFRNYNQLEISKTDSYKLGINPPVRKSGDLESSENITLIGPKGEYNLINGVIIPERHIHMSPLESQKLMIKDGQNLKIKINGEKPGVLENVFVKVKEEYNLELHLDTDDANAFLLKTGDEVEIIND